LIDRDGRVAAKYVGAVEMDIVEQEIKSLLQTK
jgi:glutathione peroxidase-family protein